MTFLKFERYETEEEYPANITFEVRPWGLVTETECMDDEKKVSACFLLNRQEATTLRDFLDQYLGR